MALPDAGSAHAGKAFLCRAMVTLYRVLAVEEAGSAGMLAAVDGGMSDNPGPELYGARYSVRPARPSDTRDLLSRDIGQ